MISQPDAWTARSFSNTFLKHSPSFLKFTSLATKNPEQPQLTNITDKSGKGSWKLSRDAGKRQKVNTSPQGSSVGIFQVLDYSNFLKIFWEQAQTILIRNLLSATFITATQTPKCRVHFLALLQTLPSCTSAASYEASWKLAPSGYPPSTQHHGPGYTGGLQIQAKRTMTIWGFSSHWNNPVSVALGVGWFFGFFLFFIFLLK